MLPLNYQHAFRDEGHFKSVADGMVKLSCPALVGLGGRWREARDFVELSYLAKEIDIDNDDGNSRTRGRSKRNGSPNSSSRGWRRKRIPYRGDDGQHHPMQYVDLFLPSARGGGLNNNNSQKDGRIPIRGTIFFVHGGAWGSGQPWMYRLVAPSFLKRNFAVVIVGYRTYPEAQTIDEQCGDVKLAWNKCEEVLNNLVVPITHDECVDERDEVEENGWVGNVIMGHSSGAHVALLMLVDMIGGWMSKNDEAEATMITNSSSGSSNSKYPWTPHYFVGLSGPYDISYHFDYEAGRGVEQISPMKPACGHTRDNFHKASPVKRLLSLFGKQRIEEKEAMSDRATSIQQLTPPILLVHGIEDSTVPFTATSDAARTLRSCGLKVCDEVYLEETGHQDVIMHFMLGGVARDVVMDWLLLQQQCRRNRQQQRWEVELQSRL